MASDNEENLPATPAKAFTEREERILKVAWFCLKSGPPDIDIQKLTRLGEFKTVKTASNTWGVLKKKLSALAPPENPEDADAAEATPVKTPKAASKKKTPAKRGKQAAAADEEDDDQEEVASPTKKAKKTPTKKGGKKIAVKEEVKSEGDAKAKIDEDMAVDGDIAPTAPTAPAAEAAADSLDDIEDEEQVYI